MAVHLRWDATSAATSVGALCGARFRAPGLTWGAQTEALSLLVTQTWHPNLAVASCTPMRCTQVWIFDFRKLVWFFFWERSLSPTVGKPRRSAHPLLTSAHYVAPLSSRSLKRPKTSRRASTLWTGLRRSKSFERRRCRP
jgi:hypothetical protein